MKRPPPWRHSTVPSALPPRQRKKPPAPRPQIPRSAQKPAIRGPAPKPAIPRSAPAPRTVARIIDQSDSSLLDVLDNLLNQGVVLNADLILALANVDLVFVRLSALLCAADRILPPHANPPRRQRA